MLKPGDTAVFLQGEENFVLGYGYAKVTFDGVTGDYAYLTLTGPKGEKKTYMSAFNAQLQSTVDFIITATHDDLPGLYYNASKGWEAIRVMADVEYADMEVGASSGYVLLINNENDFNYSVNLMREPGTEVPFFGKLHKVLSWDTAAINYTLKLDAKAS